MIISDEFLIDNYNNQKYNWADIFDVTFNEKLEAICINVGDINIEKYANKKYWFLAKWLTKFDLGVSNGAFFIGKQFADTNNTAFDNIVHFHSFARTRQKSK